MYWDYDENHKEMEIYYFKGVSKKKKIQIEKNRKIVEKLIDFCVKHFDDFKG